MHSSIPMFPSSSLPSSRYKLKKMDQDLKKTLKWNFKQSNVQSLVQLSNQLPPWRKETFQGVYGNLLDLLEVNVQTEALTALAQYFDPELRCFTFQDFQLVPTLEEFEKIMGFPAANCKPYSYVEKYSLAGALTGILQVKEEVLVKKIEVKSQKQGLSRKFLEAEAEALSARKEWKAYSDVLALLVYGIVLFPCVENFVDAAAIDVFLAFRKRGQNPTSVILADLYFSLCDRHSKGGGMIMCCLPVLYRWFVSHMFKGHIEGKSKDEWKWFIAGLKGNDILWCTLARDTSDLLYQLSGFPNVPLIGTRGCITYNPTLALRQLGYPMTSPPLAESLIGFMLNDRGSGDLSLLRRVVRAWDRPVRKGRAELGRRGTNVEEGYLQWVRLRVQTVKLPFRVVPQVEAEIPPPAPIPNEEVEELKAALLQSQKEKLELRVQLEKLIQEKKGLEQENEFKGKCLIDCKEKIAAGNQKLAELQGGLKSATSEIKVRNQDRDKALGDARAWKAQLNISKGLEKSLRSQLKEAKAQLKALTVEYEGKLKAEVQARELVQERLDDCEAMLQGELGRSTALEDHARNQDHLLERFRAEMTYLMEEHRRLDVHCQRLQEKYALLSKLCYDTVTGLPRRLRDAELAVDVWTTPAEVRRFIGYVRGLILELRGRADPPVISRKRKRNQCMDLAVI